jgi:hypothetical protein
MLLENFYGKESVRVFMKVQDTLWVIFVIAFFAFRPHSYFLGYYFLIFPEQTVEMDVVVDNKFTIQLA